MCDLHEEDGDHLFVSCEKAQHVWSFVSQWCRISSIYAFRSKDLLDWHKNVRGTEKWRKLVYAIIQVSMWVIWRSRNDLIFRGKQVYLERMTTEIKHLSFLWVGNRSSIKDLTWEEWCNFDIARRCL
ncbi:hypothetical protein HanRHA438_Chr10g0447851 [Helianthus annuus]|nr:hypothetical protein HanIR_Chr10g0469751 [Helianthus annuus]KAJ0879138.1 hypothetical protein HanRHA438_Chr10g0447851 [Helianthus annuus]